MSVRPKVICRFRVITIKILASCFGRNLQAYLKLYMEIQGPRVARIILKRQQMTTWFEDFLYCYTHLVAVELAKSYM